MSSDVFKTRFGREITCNPNILVAHGSSSNMIPTEDYYYSSKDNEKMGLIGYLKDKFEYHMLMEFVESLGHGPWKTALDIGGAEGTMARLLKADNKVDYSSVIEIRDAKNALTTTHFTKLEMMFEGMKYYGKFNKRIIKELIEPHIENFGYFPHEQSRFWSFPRNFFRTHLDDYIIGDVYKHSGKYDLITMYLCMEYFDLENLFVKINEMLNDGGTFCFLVNSWWWPVNSTGIVGEFPYACQRLDKSDFERYIETRFPKQTEKVMDRYNYFHKGKQHPTVNDFIKLAENVGLSFVGYRRLMPRNETHRKTPIAANAIEQFEADSFEEVLTDIHYFRPDVTKIDLQTAFVMGVFTKKHKKSQSIQKYLNHLSSTSYGNYKYRHEKRRKRFAPLLVNLYDRLKHL